MASKALRRVCIEQYADHIRVTVTSSFVPRFWSSGRTNHVALTTEMTKLYPDTDDEDAEVAGSIAKGVLSWIKRMEVFILARRPNPQRRPR